MRDGMSYGGIILQPKYVATQEEKMMKNLCLTVRQNNTGPLLTRRHFCERWCLVSAGHSDSGWWECTIPAKNYPNSGHGTRATIYPCHQQRRTALDCYPESKNSWGKQKQKLAQLPLLSKLLLLLASLSALIFVGSALFLHYQKKVSARTAHNQELVQAIQDKKDAADASVLYGDSKKRSLFSKRLEHY